MSLSLLPFLRKRPLVWEVRKPWHSILQRARHPGIVARLGGMVAGWKEAAGCYLPKYQTCHGMATGTTPSLCVSQNCAIREMYNLVKIHVQVEEMLSVASNGICFRIPDIVEQNSQHSPYILVEFRTLY